MSVAEDVQALLQQANAPFTVIDHAYANTSESTAIARGTPLHWGAKALVFKLGKAPNFGIFVINAHRTVNSRAIRQRLDLRRLRFATKDELLQLTGLTPGCVPPFGRPLFDLPLYVDAALPKEKNIAFSIGSHTQSVTVLCQDYLRAANPVDIFSFAESPS